MKVVAETLGVARSNLIDRLQGRSRPQRGYHKAKDAELMPQIMALVAPRPTCCWCVSIPSGPIMPSTSCSVSV